MFEIAIYVFAIHWASRGPFDSLEMCQTELIRQRAEAQAQYDSGVRLKVLGKEVKPQNVKAFCRPKKIMWATIIFFLRPSAAFYNIEI